MSEKIRRPGGDECGNRDGGFSRRDALALLVSIGVIGAGEAEDAAAQDPAKVNPRSYRVVLENDKVRVLEYRSLPGLSVCGVGIHTHPAHLTVAMTEGKVKITTEDGKVLSAENKSGEVFWAPAETHSVENISGRPMRAYMVEVKDKDWKASTG